MTPDDVNENIGERIADEVWEMTAEKVSNEIMRLNPLSEWKQFDQTSLEQQRIYLSVLLLDEYSSRY
tara:strand:+ start:5609 stop:5809 length:201 start_codon:yes stop_codon:yes gene_type:complete